MLLHVCSKDNGLHWRTRRGADGDFANAKGYYFLCDRKYDVIAVLFDDAAAQLAERVRYTPYGVARHEPLADIDGDGTTGPSDQLALLALWGAVIGSPSYDPDADFDRDGSIGPSDLIILNANFGAGGLPEGQASTIHNIIAYSGYVYDEAVDMHLARYRWFDATTGRWLSRDPTEYYDSMNLYAYVRGAPFTHLDPEGKALIPLILIGVGIIETTRQLVRWWGRHPEHRRIDNLRQHVRDLKERWRDMGCAIRTSRKCDNLLKSIQNREQELRRRTLRFAAHCATDVPGTTADPFDPKPRTPAGTDPPLPKRKPMPSKPGYERPKVGHPDGQTPPLRPSHTYTDPNRPQTIGPGPWDER